MTFFFLISFLFSSFQTLANDDTTLKEVWVKIKPRFLTENLLLSPKDENDQKSDLMNADVLIGNECGNFKVSDTDSPESLILELKEMNSKESKIHIKEKLDQIIFILKMLNSRTLIEPPSP